VAAAVHPATNNASATTSPRIVRIGSSPAMISARDTALLSAASPCRLAYGKRWPETESRKETENHHSQERRPHRDNPATSGSRCSWVDSRGPIRLEDLPLGSSATTSWRCQPRSVRPTPRTRASRHQDDRSLLLQSRRVPVLGRYPDDQGRARDHREAALESLNGPSRMPSPSCLCPGFGFRIAWIRVGS